MDILPKGLPPPVCKSATSVIEESVHELCALLLKDATSIVLVVVGVMDGVANVVVTELITRPASTTMGLIVSTPEKLTMTPIALPLLGIAKLCAVVGRSAEVATFQNTLRREPPFVFRPLELEIWFQLVGVVILSEFAQLFGENEMLATMTLFKAVPVGVLIDSGLVVKPAIDVDVAVTVTKVTTVQEPVKYGVLIDAVTTP